MYINKKNLLFFSTIGIICLFLACLATVYDFDLFARLIVGERFIEYGILPFKDFLSYTPTHPWYDHEWGSSVVFYLLLKYIGPLGFVLFQAIIMFLISVFVIKTQKLQKHAYPPSLIFMVIFLALLMKINPSLVRCHMFSFLFFSIFLYVLEYTRKYYNKNLIWILPPIVIIWNNLHGGVVSGLGLIAMYMCGALLEKKPWKKFLAVLSTSSLFLIINPYGIKYLNFLFSATTKNRKYITEWWSFLASRHVLYYMPAALYGMWGLLAKIKYRKFEITKLIVILVTLYCGLAHVKLLSITIITAAALCYNEMIRVFLKYKNALKRIEKSLYIAAILLVFAIPYFSPTQPRDNGTQFPLYEIEFLKINNMKGNVAFPFGFGSYATYKLYPDNLVFMDGRYEEVYYDREFDVLKHFDFVDEHWKDIFTKYPTDIIVPYKTSKAYQALRNEKDWLLLYDGLLCGVFIRKGTEKDIYYEPEYDLDYYKRTMFKHGDFRND